MSVTPFDPEQKRVSDLIHNEYRDKIYSRIFQVGKESITYDVEPAGFLEVSDYHLAIDGTVHVQFERMAFPMCFTVSYRFRDAERWQGFQDLTLTNNNPASGLASELYKGAVDFFTYGYHSKDNRLREVIVVNFHALKMAIVRNLIEPVRNVNKRTGQPFGGYRFADLHRLGIAVSHLIEVNGLLIPKE